jgi:glycosyltransferase involved in cell wall biosynthesis
LKILFVSHHADFVGGGELSQLQLIQALHADGEQVTLSVPGNGWCEDEARKSGVPVVHLPMPSIGFFSLFSVLRAWLKQLGDLKPDLIHANTSRSCFYAGVAGHILDIPVVFHCRIADSDPKLDWMLARLVRCVVANSKATAKRFQHWQWLDVRTIYNGVDVEVENDHVRERPYGAERVLLCVARISRWKRHDIVMNIFEQLAHEFEGLHLVCVGAKDPYEPEWWNLLQERTGQSPYADRIHWTGMQNEMSKWYQGADVLILASEREPFGRVIVEGMAHGLLVVAFNSGGPSEMIEDGVHGVLLEEDENHAARVALLLADDESRRRIVEAGRIRAGDFSLGIHVKKMKVLFRELVGEELK